MGNQANPEIECIARGVCIREQCLLVCRARGRDYVYLPGGHIEFGESARRALEREVDEELGLPARGGKFLGSVEHAFSHKGRRTAEINLVFRLSIRGLSARRPPESREAKLIFAWIPLTALGAAQLQPSPLRKLVPQWAREGAAAHPRFGTSIEAGKRGMPCG